MVIEHPYEYVKMKVQIGLLNFHIYLNNTYILYV